MSLNNENSTPPTTVKVMRPGHMIDKWRIKALLGKGACGVVYKVEDKNRKGYCAAMKIEYDSQEYDRTLQIEVHVLQKLKETRDVLKIIDCGKRKTYTYMVTTLCGKDLMALRTKIQRGFNDTTALRVALFTLYGLKQLHETGFIHRDVKPGNIMTAANQGRDARFLVLIDFGMARSFVVTGDDGRKKLRPMRRRIPLRGTIRYCSMNVHDRIEQGRGDDLIALIYTLVAVTLGLPWSHLKEEKEVMALKKQTKDAALFEDLPEELKTIFEYLKTLHYEDRPSYEKIYNLLMSAITRLKINFLDPYEWEDAEMERMLKAEQEEKEEKEKEEKEKGKKDSPKDSSTSTVQKETKVDNTAISGKSTLTAISAFDAAEEKKKKINDDSEQDGPQNTASLHKYAKLNSVKDMASSKSETMQTTPPTDITQRDSAAKEELKDLETAIDYAQSELTTKKPLPKEDLQYIVFPAINAVNFTEALLPF